MCGRPTPWSKLMVIPPFIHFAKVLTKICCKQLTSRTVSKVLVASHRAIIKLKFNSTLYHSHLILRPFPSQDQVSTKNAPDFLALVKYHSHMMRVPLRHPGEVIAKCRGGHNVMALRCIMFHNLLFYQNSSMYFSCPLYS